MPRFTFKVEVDCNSLEDARCVMAERLDPDEDYGFPYKVDWFYQDIFGPPKDQCNCIMHDASPGLHHQIGCQLRPPSPYPSG